jgi:hypothetical protein
MMWVWCRGEVGKTVVAKGEGDQGRKDKDLKRMIWSGKVPLIIFRLRSVIMFAFQKSDNLRLNTTVSSISKFIVINKSDLLLIPTTQCQSCLQS